MKQYKKIIAAVAAAAILALPLSGCSFNDVMLYLYGGDSVVVKHFCNAYG